MLKSNKPAPTTSLKLGTGKTLLAETCARDCGYRFFRLSPAELLSKWTGGSEKLSTLDYSVDCLIVLPSTWMDQRDSNAHHFDAFLPL